MTESYYSFGLIGYPLGHSLSPLIHTAALQALNLAGEYRLYATPPLPVGQVELARLLGAVRRGEIHGLNATIPHKQSLLSMVDDLSPAARTIGAVNTLVMRGDRLAGENTDAPGFAADLERCAPGLLAAGGDQSPPLALVLGAGGSARAVVFTLLAAGWRVAIATRRLQQGRDLAQAFPGLAEFGQIVHSSTTALLLDASGLQELIARCAQEGIRLALIVNTTPLGMSPRIEANPWPEKVSYPQETVVYDLVYNPGETALMHQARRAGLAVFSGLGMLVEQAALAFEIWTGLPAPRQAMRLAAGDTIRA